MTITRIFSKPSRQLALAAAGLVLAGALLAASKPSVSVQTDDKDVNRGAMEPASYSKVVKKVAPSVVKIMTETKSRVITQQGAGLDDPFFRQFFGGRIPNLRSAPQAGLGSGVVISTDGYIVTNNHVVNGADVVKVTLDDKRELKARIVGRDPQTDIAVIKVEAKDLPAITFASSSKVEVGDRVLAIGNPFGIGETVTSGIVSAMSRRAGLGLAYEDFIQTDAAINPGNSGGALVDIEGRLIGINTAILSHSGGSQGVGLAVPSDLVRTVVDSLVQNGKVVRGYLGVTIQPISQDIAEAMNLKQTKGGLISDVVPDSPADKAGLRSDDVIIKVGNKIINESQDISLAVGQTAPGTKLDIVVLRDGKEETLSATVGTMPRQSRRTSSAYDQDSDSLGSDNANDTGVLNGVAVADLDAATRRELNFPARLKGALITGVDPDSASARAGIKQGDVILEINRKPVTDAETAVKLSEESGNKKTLLKLWSRGSTITTVIDESE
jgi:serine protease Do